MISPIHGLINGCFFQSRTSLNIDFHPEIGVAAFARCAINVGGFTGFITTISSGKIIGQMWDAYGESKLTQVSLFPRFVFCKQYVGRDDKIFYVFESTPDGVFHGSWEMKKGEDVIAFGKAWCILTPVPERVFNPATMLSALT